MIMFNFFFHAPSRGSHSHCTAQCIVVTSTRSIFRRRLGGTLKVPPQVPTCFRLKSQNNYLQFQYYLHFKYLADFLSIRRLKQLFCCYRLVINKKFGLKISPCVTILNTTLMSMANCRRKDVFATLGRMPG